MHRFYITSDQIQDDNIKIIGSDVNHIKNVLRMMTEDKLIICNGQGKDYYCKISRILDDHIEARIQSIKDTGTELKAKITLFQGIPKSSKMELIIQKTIELGVHEIVPVITKRTIVKINDKKKEAKRLVRWNKIAENAAKQSGRGIIPKVTSVISYEEAIKQSKLMDLVVIPYEKAIGVNKTREIMMDIKKRSTIGIYIGPEGGFEYTEVQSAKENNIIPISLGKRILRTETAGLAILSMMMLALED